ncbi:MAG: hypothetical protein A3I75_06700 [Deltaproteobacteria bacterium RIFCSPLOWO2_02_FULL_50_16]|nr:MAG: hypothetical protein A2053_01025 [Deltaproteobacteria bacterium GWA2_50_8]OGQ25780.1 MAG: hypothetical protein A3B79_04590 [Deltaproteobacteria bacterium RIFCSPHIGHO2_02_FULL_50_15]OGQ57246.1 MAG: hypothetical protein A3I75_06700 [Deltaproteobacteria bacterium RIFCSPLOWO2_02_FULL_50_16]OGQ65538.1 MAG: hypothetical protein A3F89_06785 [Deltaproteobacteria bacterium RIFCSPLOWO2_12_FULL_50_11]
MTFKSTTATKIKNNLGDYLIEAAQKKHPVVIEKYGRPYAVLVGFQTWQEMTGKLPRHSLPWIEACQKLSEEIQRTHRKKQTSAIRLIQELRHED